MKRFYVGSCNIDKWLHQNGAEYTGDYYEGVLLDNYVVMTRRGFAAVYEHYLNANSSDYLIEWEPGPAQNVWKNWYEFEYEYNSFWGCNDDN